MSKGTGIQWTEETWNPLIGCSKVSAGCRNCYAEKAAASVVRRLAGSAKSDAGRATLAAYQQAVDLTGRSPRWSGQAVPMPHKLEQPLRWAKPRRIFVNSMSDLFHPSVSDDYIAAVFGVMAACPQHTFQVLTKHPGRAAEWFAWADSEARQSMRARRIDEVGSLVWCRDAVLKRCAVQHGLRRDVLDHLQPWPLPNVWLGVSAEDQAAADARIPHLLRCPAAIRWVSYEPALGPVDFGRWIRPIDHCGHCRAENPPQGPDRCPECGAEGSLIRTDGEAEAERYRTGERYDDDSEAGRRDIAGENPRFHWIVVGGESGPGARPFDVAWARSAIEQCREAGVACFVKQLGARPYEDVSRAGSDWAACAWLRLRDRKGGSMAEWPADLRVREWPEVAS